MIIDWLVQHGLMFLCGVTFILGAGCVLLSVLKEPILRQRCGELAILSALLWLIAAMIPMPRLLVLSGIFVGEEITTPRNASPLAVTANVDMPLQDQSDQGAKASEPVSEVKHSQGESAKISLVDNLNRAHVRYHRIDASGFWRLPDVKDAPQITAWSYLTIVIACGLWLVIGRILVAWIASGGMRIDEQSELMKAADLRRIGGKQRWFNLSSRVRIIQSVRCAIPFTYGILRPTIVLPSSADNQPDKKALVHALRHEWAHVQSGDAIGRAIMNAAFPLLAIHPLYWWLRRSSIFASELLADESAAQRSDRATYSSELIALLKHESFTRRLVLGASPIVSSKSEFYRRIEQLISRTKDLRTATSTKQRWLMGSLSLAVVCALIGFLGINDPSRLNHTSAAPIPQVDGLEFTNQWNINNVVSTSRDTPAVAIVIPKSQTVEVHGIVLDTDGAPAAGATIWAAASPYPAAPHRERVTANEEGKFVLNLRPLSEKNPSWKVVALKGSKFAKLETSVREEDLASLQPISVTANLVETGKMTCQVIEEESNQPIPDARLFLSDGRICISDEQGRINIGALERSGQSLAMLAAGRQRKIVNIDNTFEPSIHLNIRLAKCTEVIGSVLDEQGRPIPFAAVRQISNGRQTALEARCSIADQDGHFVWEGISTELPIPYLSASAIGYENDTLGQLEVLDTKPLEVSFKLRQEKPRNDQQTQASYAAVAPGKKNLAAGVIKGRVVDPNGEPVKDFRVTLEVPYKIGPNDQYPSGHYPSGFDINLARTGISYSSEDGRFAVADQILAGYSHRLTIRSSGYGEAINDDVISVPTNAVDESQEYVFQLKTANNLSVSVLNAASRDKEQPITGAKVTLVSDRPYFDYSQFTWGYDQFGFPTKSTNSLGVAEFTKTAYSQGTIAVEAPGYARQRFGWRGNEKSFVVKLAPESVVAVELLLPNESPLINPYIRIRSYDNEDEAQTIVPSIDGIVTFDQLSKGKYVLTLEDNAGELYRDEILVPGGNRLDIKLKLGADGKFVETHQRKSSQLRSPNGATTTINGRDPTNLTFQEGLDLFKRQTQYTLAETLTEEQLRNAIRQSISERKGFLVDRELRDAAAVALTAMADGKMWPDEALLYAFPRFSGGPADEILYQVYVPFKGNTPVSATLQFKIEP